MIKPYNKHDYLLERDLSSAERLEPVRTSIQHTIQLLHQFESVTCKASDLLTEDQLLLICKAAEAAYNAAANAAFLGLSGYTHKLVESVKWEG